MPRSCHQLKGIHCQRKDLLFLFHLIDCPPILPVYPPLLPTTTPLWRWHAHWHRFFVDRNYDPRDVQRACGRFRYIQYLSLYLYKGAHNRPHWAHWSTPSPNSLIHLLATSKQELTKKYNRNFIATSFPHSITSNKTRCHYDLKHIWKRYTQICTSKWCRYYDYNKLIQAGAESVTCHNWNLEHRREISGWGILGIDEDALWRGIAGWASDIVTMIYKQHISRWIIKVRTTEY